MEARLEILEDGMQTITMPVLEQDADGIYLRIGQEIFRAPQELTEQQKHQMQLAWLRYLREHPSLNPDPKSESNWKHEGF